MGSRSGVESTQAIGSLRTQQVQEQFKKVMTETLGLSPDNKLHEVEDIFATLHALSRAGYNAYQTHLYITSSCYQATYVVEVRGTVIQTLRFKVTDPDQQQRLSAR